MPISTPVQRLRQRTNIALVLCVTIEITRCCERARQQISRIDRGDLTLPGATSGFHVEEVIIKTSVPGRITLLPLRAVVEETECRERTSHCFRAAQIFSFDRDRIRRERKTYRGDR